MQRNEILRQLKALKPRYEKEGFIIMGLFGSRARDEADESSDIDLLIETTDDFLARYRGFQAFVKFDEIKEELRKIFHADIDFVDRQGLLQRGNDYILKKTLYV